MKRGFFYTKSSTVIGVVTILEDSFSYRDNHAKFLIDKSIFITDINTIEVVILVPTLVPTFK